jgi:hypothetical protein
MLILDSIVDYDARNSSLLVVLTLESCRLERVNAKRLTFNINQHNRKEMPFPSLKKILTVILVHREIGIEIPSRKLRKSKQTIKIKIKIKIKTSDGCLLQLTRLNNEADHLQTAAPQTCW